MFTLKHRQISGVDHGNMAGSWTNGIKIIYNNNRKWSSSCITNEDSATPRQHQSGSPRITRLFHSTHAVGTVAADVTHIGQEPDACASIQQDLMIDTKYQHSSF
jgi:hypothetical protein